VIYHLARRDEWLSAPDRPYAPASLADDGFIHCSADEATALAVCNTFFRDAGDLVALLIDEHKLDVAVRWEAPDPSPPPGVAADTLFPHVYGPINRRAVPATMTVQRDQNGRARGLRPLI
jgi:uncharacterized protein (DUF952 family)